MFPTRSYPRQRQNNFPNAELTGTLPQELLLSIVDRVHDPETLISLARSCKALWQQHGDTSRFASYLLAVQAAFPQLVKVDRIALPGELFGLLFDIRSKFSIHWMDEFANQIHPLLESNDLEFRFHALARAISSCRTRIPRLPGVDFSARERADWNFITVQVDRLCAQYTRVERQLGNVLRSAQVVDNFAGRCIAI